MKAPWDFLSIARFARGRSGRALCVFGLLGFATHAPAQWTVTNLHPQGVEWEGWDSWINDVSGTQQVGVLSYTSRPPEDGVVFNRAVIWNGTAQSLVELNSSFEATAQGVAGAQQVGWAEFPDDTRARVWSGGPTPFVDL